MWDDGIKIRYEKYFEWLYYVFPFGESPIDYSTITAIGLDDQCSNVFIIV